jgi:hypothetical protein
MVSWEGCSTRISVHTLLSKILVTRVNSKIPRRQFPPPVGLTVVARVERSETRGGLAASSDSRISARFAGVNPGYELRAQRAISVDTRFSKILVTRVNKKIWNGDAAARSAA